ncbi:MAG: TetR/AcrR family transcriptional regulator, partial [Bacteroidota bacterium]
EEDDFNGCWCIRTIAEIDQDNVKIKNKIREQKEALRAFIRKLVRDNLPELEPVAQTRLGDRVYLLYEMAIAESHLHGAAWPIHEGIALTKEIIG